MATAPTRESGSRGVPRRPDGQVLAVLLLASFIATVSVLMVITMLPELSRDLHASAAATQWVYLSFGVTGPIALGLLPTIGSVTGQRRTLLVCLLLLVVGTVISAAAPNMVVLIIGRFVGGFGLAAIGIALAIIRTGMAEERETRGYGWVVAAAGLAAAVGFLSDGILEQVMHASWRATFWVVAAVALIALVLAYVIVPDTTRREVRKIDYLGPVVLTGALACLMVPLTEGSTWGWGSARVISLFVAAAVLLGIWGVVESRASDPMVRLEVIARPAVLLGAVAYFVASFMPIALNLTGPQFMELPKIAPFGLGATPLTAGLVILPFAVVNAAAGYVAGRYMDRVGAWFWLTWFAVLGAAGWALMAASHSSFWIIAVALGIVGLGYGPGSAAAFTLIMRGGQAKNAAGETAGVGLIAGNLSSGVGSAVIVAFLTAQLVKAGPVFLPAESGYVHSWVLSAIIAAVGLVIAAVVRLSRRAVAAEAESVPVTAGPAAASGISN
jgi:MFS family permease